MLMVQMSHRIRAEAEGVKAIPTKSSTEPQNE